jgi:YD repeat-containing protein
MLHIDRLLLTTDTPAVPTGFGPPETERLLGSGGLITPLTRTIVYTYDNLYRLTEADYTSGESYAYSYDSVGNRLQQIIDGDTTTYQYDAANRLEQVTMSGQSPVSYTFDYNGNLLSTGAMTNTWDAANRLTQIVNPKSSIVNRYNGVGDRVGQTTSVTTTYFALDVQGLPEVIYTSEGNRYISLRLRPASAVNS